MWDNLRADTRRMREIKSHGAPWYVLESLLFENGYQAVVLYRLSHWLKRHGVPVLPALVHRWSILLTGADVAPAAEFGPGLMIGHGVGLVVGHEVRGGARVHLLHGVTLGGTTPRHRGEMPRLGDDVFVGAGACVLGDITVGDGAFIGVHAVVTEDVPAHSKVVSSATIEISRSRAPGPPHEAP